jgi:hypothetical protein
MIRQSLWFAWSFKRVSLQTSPSTPRPQTAPRGLMGLFKNRVYHGPPQIHPNLRLIRFLLCTVPPKWQVFQRLKSPLTSTWRQAWLPGSPWTWNANAKIWIDVEERYGVESLELRQCCPTNFDFILPASLRLYLAAFGIHIIDVLFQSTQSTTSTYQNSDSWIDVDSVRQWRSGSVQNFIINWCR